MSKRKGFHNFSDQCRISERTHPHPQDGLIQYFDRRHEQGRKRQRHVCILDNEGSARLTVADILLFFAYDVQRFDRPVTSDNFTFYPIYSHWTLSKSLSLLFFQIRALDHIIRNGLIVSLQSRRHQR